MKSWRWLVEAGFESLRADKAIVEAVNQGKGQWTGLELDEAPPELSRSQVQALIKEQIQLKSFSPAGQPFTMKASESLALGSCIQIAFSNPEPLAMVPVDLPLEILFEDEHLAVIVKPQQMSVHPSDTESGVTLVHVLLSKLNKLSGIGGVQRPGIVHRLDKNTSGVMVISKSDKAHQGLTELFSRHDIERRYHALCYGTTLSSLATLSTNPSRLPSKPNDLSIQFDKESASYRVESLIGRHLTSRQEMSVHVKTGKKAISYFKTLGSLDLTLDNHRSSGQLRLSLIEAKLETGRTHQVRVHLTSLGCPLLGDTTYGNNNRLIARLRAVENLQPTQLLPLIEQLPGQALHAHTLGFKHPFSQEWLKFEAPAPEPFLQLSRIIAGKNLVDKSGDVT